MNLTRLVVDQDIPDSRETILRLLIDYNLRNSPPPNFQLLGILLKDDQGQTIGGLWGRSAYEWLFVELLFVPEELRGQDLGTSLMRQAEEIARELKDHPRGISQHWLQRRFDT
jgi:GNAT superfamily N-acetyltransferase